MEMQINAKNKKMCAEFLKFPLLLRSWGEVNRAEIKIGIIKDPLSLPTRLLSQEQLRFLWPSL